MKGQSRIKLVLFIISLLLCLFALGSKNSIVVKKNKINTLKSTDRLVRLHVVANSNSLRDQHIKREIRDLMLARATDLFSSQAKIKNPEFVIKNNRAKLHRTVKNELSTLGSDYGVKLQFGKFKFPTRSYGGVTLAAGQYKALRVVLGAGKGENWWCVLFPPLCFVDSREQVTEEKLEDLSVKQKKKKEQLSVEFKFKCKEVLKNNPQMVKSKLKWIKILKTSFPGVEKLIPQANSKEKIN